MIISIDHQYQKFFPDLKKKKQIFWRKTKPWLWVLKPFPQPCWARHLACEGLGRRQDSLWLWSQCMFADFIQNFEDLWTWSRYILDRRWRAPKLFGDSTPVGGINDSRRGSAGPEKSCRAVELSETGRRFPWPVIFVLFSFRQTASACVYLLARIAAWYLRTWTAATVRCVEALLSRSAIDDRTPPTIYFAVKRTLRIVRPKSLPSCHKRNANLRAINPSSAKSMSGKGLDKTSIKKDLWYDRLKSSRLQYPLIIHFQNNLHLKLEGDVTGSAGRLNPSRAKLAHIPKAICSTKPVDQFPKVYPARRPSAPTEHSLQMTFWFFRNRKYEQ